MIGAIAVKSGREVSAATMTKLASAAVSAVAGYHLGSKIMTWVLIALLPGGGVPAAVAVNVVLNGLFTLKLGVATAKQLSRPGFNAIDIMSIVHQVLSLPSGEEIRFLKAILTGSF